VSRRAVVVLVAASLAVAVVVAGLLLRRGGRPPGEPSANPLTVTTTLDPRRAFFGDPDVARVDVRYDPRSVAPQSIRIQSDFAPFAEVGAPSVTDSGSDTAAVRTYRFTLLCLTDACLPLQGARDERPGPVVATGFSHGRTVSVRGRWRPVSVSSRLTKADLSGRIRFRHTASLPAPFGVSTRLLAGLLLAAGALLVAAAAALIRPAWRRRLRDARRRTLTPIELALAYARDSAGRTNPADRRKALELLAKAVEAGGDPALAGISRESAWAEPPPTPARSLELADEAERSQRFPR